METKELLQLGIEAAKLAGGYLSKAFRGAKLVHSDQLRDIKLAADRNSEELILSTLKKRTCIPILTEESGLISFTGEPPHMLWIVDPLDGSVNFYRGLPLCCVSISLWAHDDPVLGVIWDFIRKEMFTGVVGGGAWLNGSPVRVSSTSEIKNAVLCTGFPVSTDFSSQALMEFTNKVRSYKKVRLLGSAALSLAYVASGRVDAYIEKDIKIWDVAAGMAIVKAAGGTVIKKPSIDKYCYEVHADNSNLQA